MNAPTSVLTPDEPRGKAEAVLAAAERAFLAAGFGAVTMDAVARAAGVSKATVYAHYVGKEALFGAVVARPQRASVSFFSVEALDPVDVEASLRRSPPSFSTSCRRRRQSRSTASSSREVTRFPVLGAVFWRAGPERTRVQIERLSSTRSRGRLASLPTRASPPSSSSRWPAANSTCAACCGWNTGDLAALKAAAEGAVSTFLRAFAPQGPAAQCRGDEC